MKVVAEFLNTVFKYCLFACLGVVMGLGAAVYMVADDRLMNPPNIEATPLDAYRHQGDLGSFINCRLAEFSIGDKGGEVVLCPVKKAITHLTSDEQRSMFKYLGYN
jgi:hypothetical protein